MALRTLSRLLMAAALVTASAAAAPQRSGGSAEILNNDSIVSMTAAKVDRGLLVNKIDTTRNAFDVSVAGLISLHRGKVHQDVIRMMIRMAGDPKLGTNRKSEALDNQGVISLVTAKVPKGVILAKIEHSPAKFDTSADGLVELTRSKVPSDVIKAMLAK